MKELEFRYTCHEWFSVARSFIVLGVISTFLAISYNIIDSIASILISVVFGIYYGFLLTDRIFERKGKITFNNNITIYLNGKTVLIIDDTIEIEKIIFSSFNDPVRRKIKITGPLYVKYIIKSKGKKLIICSSSKEGFEKIKKNFFKGAFKPYYTIEYAFEALAKEMDIKIKEY